MRTYRFRPLLLLMLAGLLVMGSPVSAQVSLKIDHVPVVVAGLDSAKTEFRKAGFTVKDGYLHPNGIHNAHIEFSDATELELISVEQAGDSTALAYMNFLEQSEGGTFLALSTFSTGLLTEQFKTLQIGYDTLNTGKFEFIRLKDDCCRHIFFIRYDFEHRNLPPFTRHDPPVSGILSAEITGDFRTLSFFRKLGYKPKPAEPGRYIIPLNNEQHIILNRLPFQPDKAFRTTGVLLKTTGKAKKSISLSGLRIGYQVAEN